MTPVRGTGRKALERSLGSLDADMLGEITPGRTAIESQSCYSVVRARCSGSVLVLFDPTSRRRSQRMAFDLGRSFLAVVGGLVLFAAPACSSDSKDRDDDDDDCVVDFDCGMGEICSEDEECIPDPAAGSGGSAGSTAGGGAGSGSGGKASAGTAGSSGTSSSSGGSSSGSGGQAPTAGSAGT